MRRIFFEYAVSRGGTKKRLGGRLVRGCGSGGWLGLGVMRGWGGMYRRPGRCAGSARIFRFKSLVWETCCEGGGWLHCDGCVNRGEWKCSGAVGGGG